MALVHLNFESECLGNNTDVSIILPDKPHGTTPENFYANGKKYPVLWLLHGPSATTPTGCGNPASSGTPLPGI